MDIAALKPQERTIEIKSPADGETPLGIRVKLMAISDPRLKPIKRKIADRRLYLEQRGKHFKSDEIDENRSEISFGAMTGWEWYDKDVTFHGEKPEFNRKNVLAVFAECEWMRDQIEEAISEEKDFFGNLASI